MWHPWYRGVRHAQSWWWNHGRKRQLRTASLNEIIQLEGSSANGSVCGLGPNGSEQKPELGFLELVSELPHSAKYENFWIRCITINFRKAPFRGVVQLWRFYALNLLKVFFSWPDSSRGPRSVSRWGVQTHSDTPHSVESSGWVISPLQRSLPQNAHNIQNIHPCTRWNSNLEPSGRWDRLCGSKRTEWVRAMS
jgi:hypothetical protein